MPAQAEAVEEVVPVPLVSRPLTNWQAAGAPAARPMSGLGRSWPSELPSPAAVRASVPGVRYGPARGGRPGPGREVGAAVTGGPAMGQARSSIFMTPTY
jgi:hypothetical protein